MYKKLFQAFVINVLCTFLYWFYLDLISQSHFYIYFLLTVLETKTTLSVIIIINILLTCVHMEDI